MLSDKIKEATKTAHQRLEVLVVKRLKAIRNNADYANLLKHFYAYFSKVEQAIAPFISAEVLPDYASRRNASYLKKDIEALGATTDDLPPAQAPAVADTVSALGALYVMEGSIMGGRIIVQMLEKAGITTGVSFFSGYGEATGQMWQRFTGALNRHAPNRAGSDKCYCRCQCYFHSVWTGLCRCVCGRVMSVTGNRQPKQ